MTAPLVPIDEPPPRAGDSPYEDDWHEFERQRPIDRAECARKAALSVIADSALRRRAPSDEDEPPSRGGDFPYEDDWHELERQRPIDRAECAQKAALSMVGYSVLPGQRRTNDP